MGRAGMRSAPHGLSRLAESRVLVHQGTSLGTPKSSGEMRVAGELWQCGSPSIKRGHRYRLNAGPAPLAREAGSAAPGWSERASREPVISVVNLAEVLLHTAELAR